VLITLIKVDKSQQCNMWQCIVTEVVTKSRVVLKENIVFGNFVSHTRTVVRECCKGDYQSQWERGKFDPPPPKNPSADSHQNLCRWLRRKYLPTSKISFKSNGEPAMLHTGNFSDPEVLCSWWFFPSLVKEVMACAKEHANDHEWH